MEPRTFLGIRLSAYIELCLFFTLLFLIALFFKLPLNFFSLCPHPFWIAIIFLSVQYGLLEGLLAATLSSLMALLHK